MVDIVPKATVYVREHICSPKQMITPKKDGGATLGFSANSHILVLNCGGEALRERIDMREGLLRKVEKLADDHRSSKELKG